MNLISLSLWGADELYCLGALANARLACTVYPGWTMRVYCSPEVPVIGDLRALGVDVRVTPTAPGHAGLFWRFLPAGEAGLDYVIIRDADSRLNLRERGAVDAWMASGRPFHVMRDHPQHRHTPVLAGMWGCRGGSIPDIRERMAPFEQGARKHDDTGFLRAEIWPLIRDRCLVHTSVPSPLGGEAFPAHPPCAGFVGRIVLPRVESGSVLAVLMPSRGRPDAARAAARSARDTASRPAQLRVAVGVEPADAAAYRAAFGNDASWIHVLDAGGSYVRAMRELHRSTAAGIYGLLADDFVFETSGWDDRIRDAVADLPGRIGLVYGDDGIRRDRLATAPFVTTEWIAGMGDVLPGGYEHLFCDTELTDIARQAGLLHFLPDVKIAHKHYVAGLAMRDETYARSSRTRAAGEAEYERRRPDRRRLARQAARAAGISARLSTLTLPTRVEQLLLVAACRRDESALRAWAEWAIESGPERATPASICLFPLAWWNLQRLGASGADLDRLKPHYWNSWSAAHAHADAAAAATRAFRAAGIPMLVVGGVAIASRYYEKPHLRPVDRVSFLVPPPFADRAGQIVGALAQPVAFRVTTHPLDGRPSSPFGERVWARAEETEIGGEPTRVLSPGDEILRVCASGVRRTQRPSLHWAADLFAIVNASADRLDWTMLFDEARAAHAGAQVRIALNQARAAFAVPALEHACAGLAAAAKRRLA